MGVLPWLRRCWRGYNAFCKELLHQKESIVEAIGEGFAKWGRVCYRYPYHVMIASLIVCAAMASGLLPPTPVWIDGAEKLYSLPYSRARDDGSLHSSYFGDVLGRKSVVILKHKDEGGNILTWKHLEAIQHMDAIIRGREVDPAGSRKLVIPRTFGDQNDNIHSTSTLRGDTDGDGFSELRREESDLPGASGGVASATGRGVMDDRDYMTFEDICMVNPWGECSIDSVLKFGLHEMRQMGLLPNEPEVWVFDGTVYNTKQAAFIPEYYLGGTTTEQCWRPLPVELAKRLLPPHRIKAMPDKPGFALVDIDCIVKAEAAMLQYDADGRAQFEDRNMMWERLFIQILKENQSFGDLRVSFQAFRSRDDELRASTSESKDVVYVVFTFFILATYSTGLNFSCDLYRNKLFSALMGFGAAFMGLGAGMGIVAYMGMPMVPTVLICPFLVLGIGVDDMFVIMNCYCVSYTIHNPEDRCVQALRISGLGISITTMTNLISFGVGAFSTYMSIRNFCVYSAMALLMGYVFVLAFFFPTLCIDARREECARVCPFCLPDISDREKAARERYGHMTDEERKVLDSTSSLSQEELIAYKVNVFYEEQKIKAAARRRRRVVEARGTAGKTRPDGQGRLLRRIKELLTAHHPPTASSRKVSPAVSIPADPSKNAAANFPTSPPPFLPQHSTSALSAPYLHSSAASQTSVNKPGQTGATGDKAVAFFGTSTSAEGGLQQIVEGAGEEREDLMRLTTTIGDLHPALAREALYEEPRGNVGRKWRQFFLCYYGPFLMWTPIKASAQKPADRACITVVLAFACVAGVSIYGFTKLEMGLELSELAPSNSYMRQFDRDFSRYFNKFDQPTDIFFVDRKKHPGDSGGTDGIAGKPVASTRHPASASKRHKTSERDVPEPDSFHRTLTRERVDGSFSSHQKLSSPSLLRGSSLGVSETGGPGASLSPWPDEEGFPHLILTDDAVGGADSDTLGSQTVASAGGRKLAASDDTARTPAMTSGDLLSPGANLEEETTVRTEWWNPRVQAALREFHKKVESRPSTSRLVNPLLTMLDDPQLGPKLRMGDKQIFEDTIYYQLVHSKSPYRQFKFDFIWTGRELKTWRMRLLPKYMATSEERAAWMKQLRDDCDEAGLLLATARHSAENAPVPEKKDVEESKEGSAAPLYAVPYTYMMIFYESDLGILSSVLINMLSAGIAMLLVAFVLIPEALAGLLVIVMICLIDLALFGFMYFWKASAVVVDNYRCSPSLCVQVKLHMVSTIALVISIGFAVDYSAHLCHTFTHCKGETREKRVIESLVLMGNPVFHGACSTLLGILLLGFSESFVFSVFFRMMVMVVVFGASHGMFLLPVILSWVGPMGGGHGEHALTSAAIPELPDVPPPKKGGEDYPCKQEPMGKSRSASFSRKLAHPHDALIHSQELSVINQGVNSRTAAVAAVAAGSVPSEENPQRTHLPSLHRARTLATTDAGRSGPQQQLVHPHAASLPVLLPGTKLNLPPHSASAEREGPMKSTGIGHYLGSRFVHTQPGLYSIGSNGEKNDPRLSYGSSPVDYGSHQHRQLLAGHKDAGMALAALSATATSMRHPAEAHSAELELPSAFPQHRSLQNPEAPSTVVESTGDMDEYPVALSAGNGSRCVSDTARLTSEPKGGSRDRGAGRAEPKETGKGDPGVRLTASSQPPIQPSTQTEASSLYSSGRSSTSMRSRRSSATNGGHVLEVRKGIGVLSFPGTAKLGSAACLQTGLTQPGNADQTQRRASSGNRKHIQTHPHSRKKFSAGESKEVFQSCLEAAAGKSRSRSGPFGPFNPRNLSASQHRSSMVPPPSSHSASSISSTSGHPTSMLRSTSSPASGATRLRQGSSENAGSKARDLLTSSAVHARRSRAGTPLDSGRGLAEDESIATAPQGNTVKERLHTGLTRSQSAGSQSQQAATQRGRSTSRCPEEGRIEAGLPSQGEGQKKQGEEKARLP
ncbi:patched family protein [Cystoisospora suis]|uniref:Patched family protein n=1 Tax=Cystoisospora suis TaxID=483139 RepID=A0A2C6LCN7_9APIC|nr:patched family protein [Cystoisospora suis]